MIFSAREMSEELELVQKNEQVCALESASVPSDSCQDDDDIQPLSGKPYFDLILTRSNVGDTYKFQLVGYLLNMHEYIIAEYFE